MSRQRYTSHRTCYIQQRAIIGAWAGTRLIVVVWGFFDESGEHDKSGRLVRLTLGGFFAPFDEIKQLSERWREALDAESLSEFHMKEIASDEHRFLDWPPERQLGLKRFVDILCDHAQGFAAYSYAASRPGAVFRRLYKSGLARTFLDAAGMADQTGERGDLMFAQTDEIKGRVIEDYFDHVNWRQHLNSYAVVSSRCEPALQGAEIVARGMKRLMETGEITYSFLRVLNEGRKPGKTLSFWPRDPISSHRRIRL